ncbi:MAG: hypothetical protein PHE51_09510, partial [Eubacteriales bacterium]|nr:hypothetical protein [Eubacteriales bacterium]
MKRFISLLLVLTLLFSMVSVSTIYASGDSLVASLFVERDLMEVTFTEDVTDAAVVLYDNSVNPPKLVEDMTSTYDADTYTLKVSFGDYRIALNALHQLLIYYNGSSSEIRYFILKKLIEDHFDYASTTELQSNWSAGALTYFDANGNGVQDGDESNLWKPGNVWQGAFPKAIDAPTWKNYTLEFTHIMNTTYGDWGAGFLVPAGGKIDKGNLVQGALLFQGPPGGSGGLYAYKTSDSTRSRITGTNMATPTDAKGTTYKYKASIIDGVFRGKITGSNGFTKEVKYTVDTDIYSLNNAGNIGILEGGQGGMNDDVYLYSFQEVTPPESMGIKSWTADKESASITFDAGISDFSENIDLIDIVDSNGEVVPTDKTVELDKIKFVPKNGAHFELDTIYKFVVSLGFSDMTGSYSLMETLEQKFTLLTLFADDFESYASGAVGVTDNWTGAGIAWENGKLKSNNTWKGVYANEVAQKAASWSDYVLEYTAERGGSQFLFGTGVRVQDYTNNNPNNGAECKPGGYIYMSSYDTQSGMFLKNNSNNSMSKISSAPTLSNAVGDALEVKMTVNGNMLSTSVTGIGNTSYTYNNTVDVNATTYNYPSTGGFTFNTANGSTVFFDNVLVYKAVVPGNEPYGIENVKAEIVDGTCAVSYKQTGDVPDPAPTVMIALYKDDTLMDLRQVSAEDTASIFTNADGATSARVFVWEDLDSIRPALVLPAVRVVPAPARKRVKVQNGTVVTHEGELLRGVFTSVTGPNYSKIAATKELGCN